MDDFFSRIEKRIDPLFGIIHLQSIGDVILWLDPLRCRFGIDSGTNNPPSSASPFKIALDAVTFSSPFLVLEYNKSIFLSSSCCSIFFTDFHYNGKEYRLSICDYVWYNECKRVNMLAWLTSDEITEWVHSRSDERKQWAVPSNKNVADLCLHKVSCIFVGW